MSWGGLPQCGADTGLNTVKTNFRAHCIWDDAQLTNLSYSYDEASEAMHSSPVAVAHYLMAERIIDAVPNIGVFDLNSDAVFMACFIQSIDNHLTILAIFERILTPYAGDITAWVQRLDDTKLTFSAKHRQWMPLIQTAIAGR